ncbi:MAG: PAC2 family protein [Chloroflexi bacterium]|nr:PAC2 family protein [Chloroflexota bacterium]
MQVDDNSELTILARPSLRRPILVAAFAGWPDAGEVATGALRYLAVKSRASKMARIDAENFYDFSTLRPLASVEQGTVKFVRFPSNDFLYHTNEKSDRDLIIFLGTEPHLHWRGYLDLLLQVIHEHEVTLSITFGSFFDAVPHTRDVKVSGATTGEALSARLPAVGVHLVDYHGPSSIHTSFAVKCKEMNVESVSLWAHCPLYVRAPANPKGCHALLSRLAALVPLDISLEDLKSAGEYLDQTLSKLLLQNKELGFYVRKLEEQYEGTTERSDDPAVATERLIKEVEDFLRREQHGA